MNLTIGDLFEDPEKNQWIYRGSGRNPDTFAFRLRGRVVFVEVPVALVRSTWKYLGDEVPCR